MWLLLRQEQNVYSFALLARISSTLSEITVSFSVEFLCVGWNSIDIAPLVRARPRALHDWVRARPRALYLDREEARTLAYPPRGRGL